MLECNFMLDTKIGGCTLTRSLWICTMITQSGLSIFQFRLPSKQYLAENSANRQICRSQCWYFRNIDPFLPNNVFEKRNFRLLRFFFYQGFQMQQALFLRFCGKNMTNNFTTRCNAYVILCYQIQWFMSFLIRKLKSQCFGIFSPFI